MTVKDIIKDLAYCINLNRKPEKELLENTIGLIKHLQVENERLRGNRNCSTCKHSDLRANQQPCIICADYNKYEPSLNRNNIKAEAYKECIEKVKEEISEALKSNYKARSERIDKHNVGETDEFISYCGGKIDCLRGLDNFLDDILNEFTKG